MAGAHIRIDAPITAARASLAAAIAALANPRPLLASIGEENINATRERFRSQTAPGGAKWRALSPEYRESKPRNKDKILTLDGYLRGTIAYQVENDAVLVGSDRRYAAIHQFGGTIKPRKGRALNVGGRPEGAVRIPARPFLGVGPDDEVRLLELAEDYMRDALGEK